MYEIQDSGIRALFQISHQEDGAGITESQKEAGRQLKTLARKGNEDAALAVNLLLRRPDVHPFLKEILAA